ncbi:MAG TPA: 2,3-epoxybenzoyl-CoA dihydrolase, partial [Dongiaceae bacterium]|nr:2,3-epoxybenzoyl-CoA dihydrolase [Dongiaceae bacterium]
PRDPGAQGIALRPLERTVDERGYHYRHVDVAFDREARNATLTVRAPQGAQPEEIDDVVALGDAWWPLAMARELDDALQRIRFEHPAVAGVVITSGKERTFCAGANIYMLGTSSHAWKVNFCKFTNETRNGMEDSSRHDGLRFVAAVNGACAGGGYEIALACDEILMIDDRSTVVSLPEVPLLGVLPGTGGLTRVVDKRHVRRDVADMFCTNADGVRAERAKAWKLVDAIAAPSEFGALVRKRAAAQAAASPRPADASGIVLRPLPRTVDERGYHYEHVDVLFDREQRTATLTVRAPRTAQPEEPEAIVAAGDAWWPLAFARELDDAILMLRTNEPELGLLLLRTQGDAETVLAVDRALLAHRDHWLVRETIGLLRRTFARLDVTSRSLYAIVDQGSCFAGTLMELALAADRIYMLALDDDGAPAIALGEVNFGLYPVVNGLSRLDTRFEGDPPALQAAKAAAGYRYRAQDALGAGLVTAAPDELDWDDEIRLAVEERASLSPDALTAMEANLRFPGPETLDTKIFGRLSAWQNWVFYRPNSTGERGALKIFGTGSRPDFDQERV